MTDTETINKFLDRLEELEKKASADYPGKHGWILSGQAELARIDALRNAAPKLIKAMRVMVKEFDHLSRLNHDKDCEMMLPYGRQCWCHVRAGNETLSECAKLLQESEGK